MTKCQARYTGRVTTASAWVAGASPTRARTRRSTCTATPWAMGVPSTPSQQRRSRPSTRTTRLLGLTTATEGRGLAAPDSHAETLCPCPGSPPGGSGQPCL